ncbi:MAG: AzlC family ABC transporter permease [Alphaproteobacteria bacterium]|nr:AzlC family ABC transporter permease [Alphaproteobacteria bacterium SS10]
MAEDQHAQNTTQDSPNTWREFGKGVLDMAPLLIGLVPFALVFGALAADRGMSPLEVGLMSGLVIAGGSQFVALELWADPLPVLLLGLSALLVNSRHILMGATVAPQVKGWSPGTRYLALFLMVDELWALALRRSRVATLTPGYWFGLAIVLCPAWVALTVIGAIGGGFLPENAAHDYGLDFALAAVFLALLKDFWQGPRISLAPWVTSALVAVAVHQIFPGPWYVAAGAVAGLLVALIQPPVPKATADEGVSS